MCGFVSSALASRHLCQPFVAHNRVLAGICRMACSVYMFRRMPTEMELIKAIDELDAWHAGLDAEDLAVQTGS